MNTGTVDRAQRHGTELGQIGHSTLPKPLPLLASTHFCMDVLLRGSVLDLRSASEVLLFDPVAPLRIFAQAMQEFPEERDRPAGFEESVMAIGMDGLRRALHPVSSSWRQQSFLNGRAEHAVTVALHCRTLAEASGPRVETAYFIGLWHELSEVYAALQSEAFDAPHAQTGVAGAFELGFLPYPLREAFTSFSSIDEPCVWKALVQSAHGLLLA